MKAKLMAIVGSAILAACASPQENAFQAKQAAMASASQQDAAAVAAGNMKRSEYYSRMYDRLSQPPISPADYAAMKGASKMIDTAKQYEAGRISIDDYDSARRQAILDLQGAALQAQAQAAAQDEARRAAAMNYLIHTRPVTTNCTGTRFSASCTTY